MLVAAITEHSYTTSDDVVLTALSTGALTGLIVGVGKERADGLINHYQSMHQDQEYHICAAHDADAEPEFDLHRIAHCKDPLHMLVGERLVADDFMARACSRAPDVIVAVGDFLLDVDDWERQLCMPIERSTFPSRVEIVTRVVGMLTDTCARSISFHPRREHVPPMLVVITVPNNSAMRDVHRGNITF